MYGHQKDPTFALSRRSFSPSFIAHSSSVNCPNSVQTHFKLNFNFAANMQMEFNFVLLHVSKLHRLMYSIFTVTKIAENSVTALNEVLTVRKPELHASNEKLCAHFGN